MMRVRSVWVIGLLALAICACSPAPAATPTVPPPTADPTNLVADTEVSIPNPTVTPVTPLPENLPPGLPVDFTSHELAAAKAGKAVYSGYNCAFTADGCTCDKPTVQSVTFTFQPGNLLTYAFGGDTYGAQWEMTRISPNQWSYTIRKGADESGGTPTDGGGFFYVLTFNDTGFVLTQREDLGGGKVITCADATFTRMTGSAP